MARALKPGGSLFVLNLPKWAMHHAVFLNRQLQFRRWIVWDALSEPRGKLMPAHYALLWYTKPGAVPVVNRLRAESPQYCLRPSCAEQRKAGEKLSDVWSDIHRIKHNKRRDEHPCQLPIHLLERVILMSTDPGDVVLDPFLGTGTTAIAAKKLGRRFIGIEYVRMAQSRLRKKSRTDSLTQL